MKRSPYPVPVKRKGKRLKNKTFDFDLPFIQALIWFAGKETTKYQMKVSQAAVVKRGVLETFPALRKRYLELKEQELRETIHAKKQPKHTRAQQASEREREESAIRATAAQFDDRQVSEA